MKIALSILLSSIAFFGACAGESPAARAQELFGPGALLFSPSDPAEEIDDAVAEVFRRQHHSQFGEGRFALMFLPGDYSRLKTINVGYYTQLLGLGRSPLDVRLPNVKTPAALPNNNATCNFWVGIENVTVTDADNNDDPYFAFQWAVSQAAPARRLYVERKAVFDWFYGWASGGYVADSIFKKAAGSAAQQQYYCRSCRLEGGFFGINWNNVLQGCDGAGFAYSRDSAGKRFASAAKCTGPGVKSTWAAGGSATLAPAPDLMREKPFLFWDETTADFKVLVPALRRNATGPSWSETDPGEGKVMDVGAEFYVARPERDTAKTINAALDKGLSLILSPGIYRVKEPIHIVHPDTVVLGIGEATVIPENRTAAMICADVEGVVISGILFDAGNRSHRLLVVGRRGGEHERHAENPIVIQDTVYRVGGTGALGRAEACLEINAPDTIIDHTWIWRADHGDNTGWEANTSKNGLIVNGSDVSAYALFVEHFQEHDILWNGENGRTFFLQNEKCYDPQGNEKWMSHGGKKRGWAAYKVADGVKRHYAVGLGVYDVFINTGGKSVFLDDAIEVPDAPGVVVENACIVEIANAEGPLVGINHIVNGKGHGTRNGTGSGGGYAVQRLLRYCNGKAEITADWYLDHKGRRKL